MRSLLWAHAGHSRCHHAGGHRGRASRCSGTAASLWARTTRAVLGCALRTLGVPHDARRFASPRGACILGPVPSRCPSGPLFAPDAFAQPGSAPIHSRPLARSASTALAGGKPYSSTPAFSHFISLRRGGNERRCASRCICCAGPLRRCATSSRAAERRRAGARHRARSPRSSQSGARASTHSTWCPRRSSTKVAGSMSRSMP